MLIGQTHTEGMRQFKGIARPQMRRIGLADSAVGIDNVEGGIRTQLMTKGVGSTNRHAVFLTQREVILQSEVQRKTRDVGLVFLRQRVDSRRTRQGDLVLIASPEISRIESCGEISQTGSHAKEGLSHTTVASIRHRHRRLCLCVILGAGILIAHIRHRQDTKRSTHILQQSELSHNIFEITRAGILLHPVLREIGERARESHIEEHRQRIDVSIRGGIRCVHRVATMKGDAETVHSSVLTNTLLGNLS